MIYTVYMSLCSHVLIGFVGRIYCSPTTAALLRLKLKLKNGPDVNIIPLDLERTYTVHVGGCGAMYTDGSSVDSSATSALVPVEVVCADANHCPGAIVILFTFPNGRVRNVY